MEKEAIYIDTNIIIGLGISIIKYSKKYTLKMEESIKILLNNTRDGVLFNLSNRYLLFTAIISKYEFMRKLRKKYNIDINISRKMFDEITKKFRISMITFNGEERNFLTYDFFEKIGKIQLDLEDGIQIYIANKKKLFFITGDGDITKMKKFYSDVFTYPEIIERYEKKLKTNN